MSKQTNVTDFFSVRKRSHAQHPAKRRKVELPEEEEEEAEAAETETAVVGQVQEKEEEEEEAPPPAPDQKLEPALPAPKLTKSSFSLEILSPTKKSSSPKKASADPSAKASPRKRLDFGSDARGEAQGLPGDLPIPREYRRLSVLFQKVDGIVAIRHNRKQKIRLDFLLENARDIRVTEKHLKQIRCVFPQAYQYRWEKKVSRFGKETEVYEMHLWPSFKYKEKVEAGGGGGDCDDEVEAFVELSVEKLVERRRIFQRVLLSMVKDQHRQFLQQVDPLIRVKDDSVTKWHPDFDPESCPEIDEVDFPPKPDVVTISRVSDAIEAMNDAFGVNKQLQQTILEKDRKPSALTKSTEETAKTVEKSPAVRKELKGLPQALLDRLKAKERERTRRQMTENSEDKKERLLLSEVNAVARQIINCYKSECETKKRKGLETTAFFKFVAHSNGRKSPREMEKLIRHFVKVAPGFLDFVYLHGVEYIKQCGPKPPDSVAAEAKVKDLMKEK